MPWTAWTTKDLRIVEEMRLEGATLDEIAKILNRTAKAVHNKAALLEATKWNRQSRYIELFQSGVSDPCVAETMGVTLATAQKVRYRLKKQGVDIKPTYTNGSMMKDEEE